MTFRKRKKIRQLAPGQGKMTNTEGQVGEAEISCLLSRNMTSSNSCCSRAGPGCCGGCSMTLVAAVAEMALIGRDDPGCCGG